MFNRYGEEIAHPDSFLVNLNMMSSLCDQNGDRLWNCWEPFRWSDIGGSNFRFLNHEKNRWKILERIMNTFNVNNNIPETKDYSFSANAVKWMLDEVSLYRLSTVVEQGFIGVQGFYTGKKKFSIFDEFPTISWAGREGEIFTSTDREVRHYVQQQLQDSLNTPRLYYHPRFCELYSQLDVSQEK